MLYFEVFFIAIFFVSKDAFAVDNKTINEKSKGNKSKAKAHIGLCIELMAIKIIPCYEYRNCYQQTHVNP